MDNQPIERKKVIFSAIQPSGTITLGNYLGALKNWVALQDEFDCIFALADLHTIGRSLQSFAATLWRPMPYCWPVELMWAKVCSSCRAMSTPTRSWHGF